MSFVVTQIAYHHGTFMVPAHSSKTGNVRYLREQRQKEKVISHMRVLREWHTASKDETKQKSKTRVLKKTPKQRQKKTTIDATTKNQEILQYENRHNRAPNWHT